MNSLAQSVRCHALRCPLEMAARARNSLDPWPRKNLSIACVRQAGTTTKSGMMSRLKNIFHRSSDGRASTFPPTRRVMGLAPRAAQPPIREPNMSEKRDKRDEKKEKKDKKPVVKTDFEDDANAQDRDYRWGVKVADDNHQLRERNPGYVMNEIWGVNAMKYASLKTATSERPATVNQAESYVEKSTEATPSTVQTGGTISRPSMEETQEISSRESTAKSLHASPQGLTDASSDSRTSDETAMRNPQFRALSTTSFGSEVFILQNDDYNDPSKTPKGGEISAWQEVVTRTRLHEEIDQQTVESTEKDRTDSIFIRPEPPEPKLDVQVVGTVTDVARSESNAAKSLNLSPNTAGVYQTVTRKLYTNSKSTVHHPFESFHCPNYCQSSNADGDSKDFQTFRPVVARSLNLSPITAGSNQTVTRKLLTSSKCAVHHPFQSFHSTNHCLSSNADEDTKDFQTFRPVVAKSLNLSPNTAGSNQTVTRKLLTSSKCTVHHPFQSFHSTNRCLSSSADGDGQDFPTSRPESESLIRSDADSRKQVEASQNDRGLPNAENDLTSVLQELSPREMEVLLSYTKQTSEETGTSARLPTSVDITTFPTGSCRNESDLVEPNEMKILNIETSNDTEMTELEKTMLKLSEGERTRDDGKDKKDKKSYKDGDYIKLPGDPYPYNREHYEKWRVPHGRCPIVNDDVPKAKPAETSDSPW